MTWLSILFPWFKAFHLIAMVAWMAGMFYLPRLFVYHAAAAPGSETAKTFEVMELKLLRMIINPAMIATWLFGGLMIAAAPGLLSQGWLHVKLILVLAMSGLHGYLARSRRQFAKGPPPKPSRHWRIINEIPTVLLIAIVLLAVLKPF